jgi:putative transposase
MALLAEHQDFLRPLVQAVLQELLEAEMTETLGAEKGERAPAQLGHHSGYYDRTLGTRVGKLELRRARPRRSPRSSAAKAPRPRRSARSTSGWTRSWPNSPAGGSTRLTRT